MPPGITDALDGVADKVKSGGPVTFRVTAVVLICEPLVPVTVSIELPTGVLVIVSTVKVELAPGPIETGLNDAVAPDGKPLAVKFTDPPNPLMAVTLMV